MNLLNIKNEINRLVNFDEKDFIEFAKHLTQINIKKNEIWEHENVISRNMGFVNSGILRQYYIKEGLEYTDLFFTENDFIGNYISHLTKDPSNTFTVAVETCDILVIPFLQLEKLILEIPIIQKFSKIIGDQKLFALNKRSSSLLMDTAEERYYKLIETKPDLINRVPQYLIAQYLGIKPESLSRIRKRRIS